jgi:hypothetical protein
MPSTPLQRCRSYLSDNYREKLGYELADSIAELSKERYPVWRFIAANDLTSEVKPKASGAAGLLLDPEIGILAYFLPFDATTPMRKQILRALALRSQLSTERNYSGTATDTSDPQGAWRVVIHWLVASDHATWIDQIMEVRRETAFSEELSMDAVFLQGKDVDEALREHGFPRLLLTTRQVLRKPHINEMTTWLSANDLVARALKEFERDFNSADQRELAAEVVRSAQSFRKNGRERDAVDVPEKPRALESIEMRDFRNLRNVHFDFGLDPVGTRVIHGPNGTGKSSVCEAISIALFGSSARYRAFASRAREKDVTATNRTEGYIERYLTPIESPNAAPRIALNGAVLARPSLVGSDETDDADLAMAGTILTQDTTLEFGRMTAAELGSQVLRGYSELADHVEAFTESRYSQANSARQDFLRGLGLMASITKLDTAFERLARREIDQSLPTLSHPLVEWLEQLVELPVEDLPNDLHEQWKTWGSDENRSELAKKIASAANDNETIQRALAEWLERYNELTASTAEVLSVIERRTSQFRSELEVAAPQIRILGEWLDTRAQRSGAGGSPEARSLAKKLEELQTEQKGIVERGRNTADHLEHLHQVRVFVQRTWSKHHADECPTCGDSHAERGGISNVIEALVEKTGHEREQYRERFTRLKAEIEGEQRKLAALGQAQAPLSPEERSRLQEALQWLVPATGSFEKWITVRAQREKLMELAKALRQPPSPPTKIDAEGNAERVSQAIVARFREAEKTFEAPNNWKPVKDKLAEILGKIVAEHLPSTLERLWLELMFNLTAAAWLLPERPRVAVTTRRGEQKASVRVAGRLARYVLNQAELHVLGMAWFFTRYLTHGRFFYGCMVMDDAAQELDQTSFRELCRLWETWVRLHRVYKRPLKLVLLLNQESRALDAARATGGILGVLSWTPEQQEAPKAISLLGEGFFPPQPTRLFESIAS